MNYNSCTDWLMVVMEYKHINDINSVKNTKICIGIVAANISDRLYMHISPDVRLLYMRCSDVIELSTKPGIGLLSVNRE